MDKLKKILLISTLIFGPLSIWSSGSAQAEGSIAPTVDPMPSSTPTTPRVASSMATGTKKKKTTYSAMTWVSGTMPGTNLYLMDRDKTINFQQRSTTDLRFVIKGTNLLRKRDLPGSIRLDAYAYDGSGNKIFLSKIQKTVLNKKDAKLIQFKMNIGAFNEDYKTIYVDLHDTKGTFLNTYRYEIAALNTSLQAVDELPEISAAECSGTEFDECHIKYFLDHVDFEAVPRESLFTQIKKQQNGNYLISIPVTKRTNWMRKSSGKKLKSGNNDNSDEGTSNGSLSSKLDLGSSDSNKTRFAYNGTNGDLGISFPGVNANDLFTFTNDGRFGIQRTNPEAFINIRGGTADYPSIKIEAGTLTTTPKDGAIEYDGTDLYFTSNGTRMQISLSSRGISSLDNVVYENEIQTVSNKTFIDSVFSGSLQITPDAGLGKVLVSDANGFASWSTLSQLGSDNSITGNGALAIGNYLNSNGTNAIVIGSGNNGSDLLINDIDNSLMVGFNSNAATLFVGTANGSNSIGHVGIGTTNPSARLDVNGDIVADNIDLRNGITINGVPLDYTNASNINSGVLASRYGGTGVSNDGGALTFGSNDISFSGGDISFTTISGSSSITLPSSGILATRSNPETLSNKYLLAQDGDEDEPSITFTDDTDTGLFRAGENSIAMSIGGETKFVIDQNGSIGIGTINPTATLDINGQLRIRGGSPAENYVLTSDSNGLATWADIGSVVSFGTFWVNDLNDAISNKTSNIFIGNGSGLHTTGLYNTGLGILSLNANIDGEKNTAIGFKAGFNSNGDSNIALGYLAMVNGTTASNNTILGSNAGTTLTTGNNNILIGAGVNTSSPSTSNELNIGDLILGNLLSNGVTISGDITITGDTETNSLTTNTLSFSGATSGSIIFAGSTGALTQDNNNFFWDDTNNIFMVGSNSFATADFSVSSNGSVAINSQQNSLSYSLKVSSAEEANALTINGGLGYVGVGTDSPNSTVHINGSLSLPVTRKTSTYTLSSRDFTVLADANGSSMTINLPSAAGMAGRVYFIKKVDGSTNQVTITPAVGEEIDNDASYTLSLENEAIQVQSDGSDWFIF